MTTAGRPTYFSKVGSGNPNLGIRSNHVSGKDQTAHTKLKFRQSGQNNPDDINKRHLKEELDIKEKELSGNVSGSTTNKPLLTDEVDNKISKLDKPKLLTNEQEELELQEQLRRDGAAKGNPLLHISKDESAKLKRRWNDDVVFRNQAKDEPEHKKRFINDTIRNDFHRLFLNRYFK
eukprot:gene19830-25778_t